MAYKGIFKNRYQTLADSNQRISRYISGNDVFDILIAGQYVSAVSAVPGFEQGITDEIYAFMMAFEEHGTFLYYLEPLLDYHRTLFFNGFSAPSFVALGKPFPDKTDSFSAAGQR